MGEPVDLKGRHTLLLSVCVRRQPRKGQCASIARFEEDNYVSAHGGRYTFTQGCTLPPDHDGPHENGLRDEDRLAWGDNPKPARARSDEA